MKQSPQQYFDEWNQKGIDFDGYFGDQCMDNFLQYNQDVVGAPRVWGNAIDVPTTFPPDFYTWIPNNPNDPNQVPLKGDVVVFNFQPYGHIAMIFAAEPRNPNFTSFDQNWQGHQFCEYVVHNYQNVIGWLRPKTLIPSPSSSRSASASPSSSESPSDSPSASFSPSTSPSASTSPSSSPSPSLEIPEPQKSWLQILIEWILSLWKTRSRKN